MPRFGPWPGEFPIKQWDPEFRQRVSPDGKTYGNMQEEPVRQWAAIQLAKNFGMPHCCFWFYASASPRLPLPQPHAQP